MLHLVSHIFWQVLAHWQYEQYNNIFSNFSNMNETINMACYDYAKDK